MYKLFSFLPTPILCILCLIGTVFSVYKLIQSKRARKHSRIPLLVFVSATGPLAFFMLILRDLRPELFLEDSIGISLVIWLAILVVLAFVCTLIGYKKGEYSEPEAKKAKIALIVLPCGVLWFILMFIIIKL